MDKVADNLVRRRLLREAEVLDILALPPFVDILLHVPETPGLLGRSPLARQYCGPDFPQRRGFLVKMDQPDRTPSRTSSEPILP